MSPARSHIAPDLLLQDWLGEADAATRETIDEHLMACDACGVLFDEIVALGEAVRRALRAGLVFAVASGAFVERLRALGLRVRLYDLAHNGTINCTVSPDDQVLAARLQAPLRGVRRLDLVQEVSLAPGERRQVQDVPFDAAHDELVFVVSVARVRPLPAHTKWLTLIATDDQGTREVGRYEFRHTPWPA
ncbi:hypothetical protein JJB11_01475 [Ramlibacter ginsenosidimutans]|uniref:Zinc-finger domain-containing protein n=1 Tax=Ramlibacter ginsenosidimutans TaxID=502333 RepID=A0A934TQE4_9BURK|nr:hypothetical protein [Ramlibacter ginsenosidimutans]MBK6004747.1 hypothetical protein [Ramlibacter ginsenosidimutans]